MPLGRAARGEAPASSRRQHGGVWRVSSGAPGPGASYSQSCSEKGAPAGSQPTQMWAGGTERWLLGSWALSTTHHTTQHPHPSTPKGSNFRQSQAPPHTHSCRQVPAPAAKPCLCPFPKISPPALAQLPLIWPGLGHTGCSSPVGTACELFPSPHLWLFSSAVAWSCPGCFITEPWECHPESLTPERGAGAAPLNPHRCYKPLIHFNPIMSPCGCFQFWPLKK